MTLANDPADADRFSTAVRLLQDRTWFEAHEVLEASWRDARGVDRDVLQSMIHAAVALEHLRRGNRAGAASQCAKAQQRLANAGPGYLGVDVKAWVDAIEALLDRDEIPPPEQWPVPRRGT